jgi:hypothetical protein
MSLKNKGVRSQEQISPSLLVRPMLQLPNFSVSRTQARCGLGLHEAKYWVVRTGYNFENGAGVRSVRLGGEFSNTQIEQVVRKHHRR